MRKNILLFVFGLIACHSTAVAADFGSIAACASLKSLPKGARIVEGCKSKTVMRSCTFSLKKEKYIHHYVVENNRIVNKIFNFKRGSAAPFGIKKNDTPENVQKKLTALTGSQATKFSDDYGQYVQSAEMACSANTFRLYVFFKGDKVDKIASSSLPPM